MNERLTKWLIANSGVAADASDEVFEKALETALADKSLSDAEYAKLAETTPDKKKELADLVGTAVAEANAPIAAALEKLATSMAAQPADTPADPPVAPEKDSADVNAIVEAAVAKAVEGIQAPAQPAPFDSMAFIASGKGNVRVKKAVERYRDTKTAAICPQHLGRKGDMPHPRKGLPALEYGYKGRELNMPTEKDYAIIGAWAKFTSPWGYRGDLSRMPDHERDLVLHAIHEGKWSGEIGFRSEANRGTMKENETLTDREMRTVLNDVSAKAVLDDATSGGSYSVPQELDEAAILVPLLYGELFPLVDLQQAKTSQVDAFTLAQVPILSGHGSSNVEGTALSLTSTASLIGNFDTSIFAATAGVEWGRDWESDSVMDFGRALAENIGESFKEWLDNQIANGDGTTEPEGIFTASGLLSVASANGTSGPYTIGDMEDLAWKVSKAYRNSKGGNRNAFVSSDTGYKRVRAVPITTSDDRRLFSQDGSNIQQYVALGYPFKIQDDISNGRVAFGNFAWYTMYRRLGMRFEMVTGGQTLALKNTQLLVMRARYGGRVRRAGAFAKMTDGAQTG